MIAETEAFLPIHNEMKSRNNIFDATAHFKNVMIMILLILYLSPFHEVTPTRSSEINGIKPLPALKTREELGGLLESLNFTSGVELGVQRGIFAEATLKNWPSCKEYHLVDIWKRQENYFDQANYHDQDL